jgi:hypothetical protein
MHLRGLVLSAAITLPNMNLSSRGVSGQKSTHKNQFWALLCNQGSSVSTPQGPGPDEEPGTMPSAAPRRRLAEAAIVAPRALSTGLPFASDPKKSNGDVSGRDRYSAFSANTSLAIW